MVGTGPELTTARHAAYATIAQLELKGSFYRTDIARRAADDAARRAADDAARRPAEDAARQAADDAARQAADDEMSAVQ